MQKWVFKNLVQAKPLKILILDSQSQKIIAFQSN